ncbi:MAG: ABC transporter ATP-binding protein [Burkholderiaceae bacterium]|jgi:ABC-type lipoprotein export system ATPase subunit|nr:ABC transporter ATP-binding protein [Burkholderiaceae bacterium]
MSDAPLLVVSGLGRDFDHGRVRALHDVSFSVGSQQTVALLGPSGCGKSTLLSLIGMLDRPDRGRIEVSGMDLATVRRGPEFRARRIGFVFQFHHMVPTMTLQENVEAPMLALRVPRTKRRERAAELLAQMDLASRAGSLPGYVSGGERQRAAVARALANRPALVLADEPTGNLDSVNGQRVMSLLVHHARNQQALLLVATHNPEIAAAMDRRIELRDGVLV